METIRNGSGEMFDTIADRYDFLNRVMSLGVDRGWRKRSVGKLAFGANAARVLDLATGTGDMALQIARRFPAATVVGLDPSKEMLKIGGDKVTAQGLGAQVTLVEGDAERLPFADNSFDAVTMAFGIRNVIDRPRALTEMARVVRPGGQVIILELNEPTKGALAPIVRWHVHHAIPALGAFLSGRPAYRYLQESIAAFPEPATFVAMMESSGLTECTAESLTFGAAFLYGAVVPQH